MGISDVEIKEAFMEHFVSLHRYAYTLVRDSEKAKDLVQQVFVRVCKNKEQITIEHSIKAYLFRSVHNYCINSLNRDKTFDPLETISKPAFAGLGQHSIEVKELRLSIQRALEKLPPQCKQVFLLSRDSGKTYQQISQELNISVKTVEAHISKALKSLKQDLNELI
ncbi:MAG: hypothetical protein A1D16_19545 [Flavihumibacter sp. CACIAM 22H1]|nr:MAG: hypothetical protein A1D16_19545 [Flavihumibacter sp. CACIAM 22H1]